MTNRLAHMLLILLTIGVVGCGGGSGGEESSAPSTTTSMPQSTSYAVSAAVSTGGTLTPAVQTVAENGTASVTLTADPGYRIISASGCAGSLSGNTFTTGNITASCTVTAAFELQTYSVLATAGTGGSITPGQTTVTFGEATSFTLSPNKGFKILAVSGCGGTLDANLFTTAGITGDCVINASFTPILYKIGGSTFGLVGSLELLYQFGAGSEILEVAADGNFAFIQLAQLDSNYQISINTQPAGQQCTLADGSGIVAGDVSNILVTCEALISTFSVSGKITPAATITVDSDINDLLAPFLDNSVASTAQQLNHLAHLHGFASAQATGGDTNYERFALVADADDMYKVTLEAGQIIQLQVVDYKSLADGGKAGDLDLYLFDINYQLTGASEGSGEFEELVAPTSQDYFINIHAHAGISKYVLRLLPASTTVTNATAPPEFVPNEMIVKYVDDPSELITETSGTSAATDTKGTGRNNTTDPSRIPTRGSRQPGREPTDFSRLRPNHAMAEMKRFNQTAYDKVMTLRSIKTVSQQPDVVYAEPNYLRKSLLTPNDSNYSLQWHYAAIGLPQAWETTTGSGAEQSVIVAVVDTGIVLAHPDMSGQLVGGYDFISNVDRARDGDGIDADANDPGDSDQKGKSSWHGTHVGGTVAAASNNSSGVAGVSWGAKLMPIRILGKDGGTSYDIIQGLRYAAGLSNDSKTLPARRADIANLSFGGTYKSLAEQEAYRAVRAAGVILVAAAGNSASSEPLYPAAYPEVISVSATDYANKLAPYSSFGSTVALAAPGGNNSADLNNDGQPDGVLSTSADDSKGSLRYVYRFYNGTSMATPHVAGVLALMKAVYPALTPDDVDALIQAGSLSDDLGKVGRDDIYGYGFTNAVKAVNTAMDLAAGAQLPADLLPEVVATPARADLGFFSSTEITLSNQGGGDPVVVSVTDSAEWLTVSPNVLDASGMGSYVLGVNRTDLTDGSYESEVVFDIDDGSRVVLPVTMQVDTVSNAGELTQLYVLLIDSETSEVVAETATQTSTDSSVSYTLPEVPDGNYYVFAGSDIDADNFICQLAEVCGSYLNLTQPQLIQVNGASLQGIDFIAEILHSFSATTAAPKLQPLTRQ